MSVSSARPMDLPHQVGLEFQKVNCKFHSVIPPYIIQAQAEHFARQKKSYSEKKSVVQLHHLALNHQLDALKKETKDTPKNEISLSAEQIEEIKKIITGVIALIKTLNEKKTAKNKEISEKELGLANFNLDQLSDFSLPEIKQIVKDQVQLLLERIEYLESKKQETKKNLHLTEKQLKFDQNHFHLSHGALIIDKIIEAEQKIREKLEEWGNIILHRGQSTDTTTPPTDTPAPTDKPAISAAVYDAQNRSKLPGKLVFDNAVNSEEQLPSLGEAVTDAYQNTIKVLIFWEDIFKIGFKSESGATRADSVIHYMKQYVNAFFDGNQMVYGDGNKYFDAFYRYLEIAGHEMGHSLVPGLNYKDQSGALNESYADIFGACTEMYTDENSVENYHWQVGKDLITYKDIKHSLRTFKNELAYTNVAVLGGDDPQPLTMPDANWYVENASLLAQDEGGVHILSKIPNRVFYMVCIDQKDWKEPVLFWKRVLDQIKNPDINFADFAALQIKIATKEGNQALVAQLQQAWATVGVVPTPAKKILAAEQPIEKELEQLIVV